MIHFEVHFLANYRFCLWDTAPSCRCSNYYWKTFHWPLSPHTRKKSHELIRYFWMNTCWRADCTMREYCMLAALYSSIWIFNPYVHSFSIHTFRIRSAPPQFCIQSKSQFHTVSLMHYYLWMQNISNQCVIDQNRSHSFESSVTSDSTLSDTGPVRITMRLGSLQDWNVAILIDGL